MPSGKDLVELEERTLERVKHPLDVGKRDEFQPVFIEDGQPFVVPRPFHRIGDDGLVLHGNKLLPGVTVLEERPDDALDLPGLARAGREVFGPGEIELDQDIPVFGEEASDNRPGSSGCGYRRGPSPARSSRRQLGPGSWDHLEPMIRTAAAIQRKRSRRRGLSLMIRDSGEPPSAFRWMR